MRQKDKEATAEKCQKVEESSEEQVVKVQVQKVSSTTENLK